MNGMNRRRLSLIHLIVAGIVLCSAHAAQDAAIHRPMGPLQICTANPRYFADPSGRAVYLTGSHTWQSLQDGILSDYTVVTQPFDYTGYLDLLQKNHHNFIRLWRWELATHEPQPWQRTGPGTCQKCWAYTMMKVFLNAPPS